MPINKAMSATGVVGPKELKLLADVFEATTLKRIA